MQRSRVDFSPWSEFLCTAISMAKVNVHMNIGKYDTALYPPIIIIIIIIYIFFNNNNNDNNNSNNM